MLGGESSVSWGHSPSILRNSSLLRQAAVPDAAGLRGAEHSCRQGPVPGLPGGSLLPTAVGPAAGSLQVLRPQGWAGLPQPPPRQPLAFLPTGACTRPTRRPWPAAWSGTGMLAPPTWGWRPGSYPRRPAALRTAPPSRTCASSHWRPVPAGSWSALVSALAGRDLGGFRGEP